MIAVAVPVAAAAMSPLLAWRDPVYIAAGFAGVVAMALLLFQPLLAAGQLPGVSGLWVTSPPDVIDALLFASPTPFSAWGVIAMWALFASALLAGLRRRLRPRHWRRAHTLLAAVIVVGSVVHAMLIEGTMETFSKAALCALVVAATLMAFARLRVWAARTR